MIQTLAKSDISGPLGRVEVEYVCGHIRALSEAIGYEACEQCGGQPPDLSTILVTSEAGEVARMCELDTVCSECGETPNRSLIDARCYECIAGRFGPVAARLFLDDGTGEKVELPEGVQRVDLRNPGRISL